MECTGCAGATFYARRCQASLSSVSSFTCLLPRGVRRTNAKSMVDGYHRRHWHRGRSATRARPARPGISGGDYLSLWVLAPFHAAWLTADIHHAPLRKKMHGLRRRGGLDCSMRGKEMAGVENWRIRKFLYIQELATDPRRDHFEVSLPAATIICCSCRLL